MKRLLASSLLVTLSFAASTATAQNCLLTPVAVPGLSGLPFWYSDGGATVRTELDDPRWAGGPFRAFQNDAGGTSAGFRAVRQGNILAISFQALADLNSESDFDAIWLGVATSSTGSTAGLLRLSPATGSGSAIKANFGDLGTAWSRTSGAWGGSSSTAPPWLVDIDTATADTQFATWNDGLNGAVWAINIKIDLGVLGVPAGSDFRIFYGMDIHVDGVDCLGNPEDCEIVPYSTPAPSGALVPETPVPEDPSTWELTEDLSTSCATGARVSSIRVDNADGMNRTTIDTNGTMASPATTAAPALNTFHATVTDLPSSAGAGAVLARFSFAHWGSTIADSNAPWNPVVIDPVTTTTTSDDVLALAVANQTPSGGSARIDFECAAASTEVYCPTLPSGAHGHQCMLVELRSASSNPTFEVKFAKAAAYQNMNFENLSELERVATIDLKGLEALTGAAKDRDVYLYVRTSNLPSHGAKPMWLPAEEMARAKAYAENLPPRPPLEQPKRVDDREQPGRAAAAVALARPPALAQATKQAKAAATREVPVLTEHQRLREVWPTYEVHAYYDSGEFVVRRGAKLRKLVEMVPFGFYLNHDGPLYGFSHQLSAMPGVDLKELIPNVYYKVGIKNEQSVQLRTKVVAHEEPVPKPQAAECLQCEKDLAACKAQLKDGRCGCRFAGDQSSGSTGLALGLLALLTLLARRRFAA